MGVFIKWLGASTKNEFCLLDLFSHTLLGGKLRGSDVDGFLSGCTIFLLT